MKKILSLIIILLFHICCSAQVDWVAYPHAPVLSMDTTSNMWGAYGQPTVIIHNDTIKMWYAVAEGENPTDPIPHGRIHYAWSLDGISWIKYPGNPVLDIASAGQWDGQWLDSPEILWDGTEFKLYYYGDSTYNQGQSNTAIGLANSQDGIHWTRHGIVLEKGNPGDWDGKFIESPAAYHNPESGLYALLYTGIDTIGYAQMGLAVSMDGNTFMKYPDYPVVPIGPYPGWNDIASATPALFETDGIIEMWYSGISNDNGQYDSARVGYAVSLNGINWIQYPGNPILTSAIDDRSSFWAVDVVFDSVESNYKLYYEDFLIYGDPQNPDTVNAIFYATAPRNILYSVNCNTGISNDTTIFQGGYAQLLATGGDYFLWEPAYGLNNNEIANPIASPDSTVTYTVLIVGDSCITKALVTVEVAPLSADFQSSSATTVLKIGPNPFHDFTNIEIQNRKGEEYTLKMYSIQGQLMKTIDMSHHSTTRIEKRGLPAGMYYLELHNKNEHISTEMVIIE